MIIFNWQTKSYLYVTVSIHIMNSIDSSGKIRFCPKCGSTNLKSLIILGTEDMADFASATQKKTFVYQTNMFSSYLCRDCGFKEQCPEATKAELKEFQKEINKQ